MVGMVLQYMRGDATGVETYIELCSLVYEYKQCKEFFARSKLTIDAIRCKHADFYNLPADTRYNASAISLDQKIELLKELTTDDFVQSQQTISLILNSEGTGTQCINQNAPVTSAISRLDDWAGGRDRHLRRCDFQIERLPSHSGGVFNRAVTCDKWENSKPISSIDTGHASIEHWTKTD